MNKETKIEKIYLIGENCYTQLLQSAIETLLKGLLGNYGEKRFCKEISNNNYTCGAFLNVPDLNGCLHAGSKEGSSKFFSLGIRHSKQ